jgi:tetratricopeptide (TPR) repeat protein
MRLDNCETARGSRAIERGSRKAQSLVALLAGAVCLFGCKEKPTSPALSGFSAQALFDEATHQFHARSAEANSVERERLLREAAQRYEQLLKQFPAETNLCAQALRALGNVHASQGSTNEAVKFYATVGERYSSQDWEVLQAWKAAGDLLWDSSQRGEAKKFYARIVERFGHNEASQVVQQVVRGSKARLQE